MAIKVDRPEGLPATGRYEFSDSSGSWKFSITGKWGKCKQHAIAAYKRDNDTRFGVITVKLIE